MKSLGNEENLYLVENLNPQLMKRKENEIVVGGWVSWVSGVKDKGIVTHWYTFYYSIS